MSKVEFIAHRVNTLRELTVIDQSFGVELDLRDNKDNLYISHDPFSVGDDFEEYVRHYNHGTMIINIKSERIEYKILEIINKCTFNYFFLDSSFPMIKLLAEQGEKKIALRYSEFEGLDTLIAMSGKVDWVWVDCFTKFPMNKINYNKIRELGYKICIVSPELQGQDERIEEYGEYMLYNKIIPDAICSKVYNKYRWDNFFSFFQDNE
jgi:hypothetical protein